MVAATLADINGRAFFEREFLAVEAGKAFAFEHEKQLFLVVMHMFADHAARIDRLRAHRKTGGPAGGGGIENIADIAVGRHRLPEGRRRLPINHKGFALAGIMLCLIRHAGSSVGWLCPSGTLIDDDATASPCQRLEPIGR